MAPEPIVSPGETTSSTLTPWILWAKWTRGSKTAGSYHPVLCHLIDVAMVTEALWRRVLPDHWKERFARSLGVDDVSAECWVVFWAGLHDLGKVCPGFQLQLQHQNPTAHALIQQRVRDARLPAGPAPWVPHGAVSALALRDILPQQCGLSRELATTVALAVGGHHGSFPSYAEMQQLPSDGVGRAGWRDARVSFVRWLAQAVVLPETLPASSMGHATAMVLAGLVSVADWIGSSELFFNYAAHDAHQPPDLDIATYCVHARTQAAAVLDALGWTGWTPSRDRLTFAQLFPDIKEPRPLQQTAVALSAELDGPGIVIVESPMGEGKTEVAMFLADHWGVALGQSGIYFALPTQATSDGMFTRVRSFLSRRYPGDVVNLQLLHGRAALSETLKELREHWRGLLAPSNVYGGTIGPDSPTGSVVAAEWFAASKRALLAPFGVGTVDQALLGALQVTHIFVRLYGLSTKTVIVDEVHAYDTYMSTLLERLLEWLGAFNAPVVLLSATLPRLRREALLAAYARGAGWTDSVPRTTTRYPRITWASESSCDARETAVSPLNCRPAHVGWLPGGVPGLGESPPFPLGEHLAELLAAGGCAAVICNTVGRAQKVYRALERYFPGNASDGLPTLDLLHARYPYDLRMQRERRVLGRFGKDGPRPDRAVVIATQVIEQSLDLDFDVMITDLAPADLILQRMGRLQRHERPRPPGLGERRVLIVRPDETADGVPAFERGDTAVYNAHVLLRSYLALSTRNTLALPDDIETLVESVYGERECPDDASPAVRTYWDTTREELHAAQVNERRQAENRYIKRPTFDGPLYEVVKEPREEDAPELHPVLQALTRLTDVTVSLICLAGTEDHPLLYPDGPAVDLKRKPSQDQVEALLLRSVNLSAKRVVRTLLEREVPASWSQIALLRNHRFLVFDAQGVAEAGKWRIRLDPDLGIFIE